MEHAQQLFLQRRRNTNTKDISDKGEIEADNADVNMITAADRDAIKKRLKKMERYATSIQSTIEKEMRAYPGEKSKYNEELIRYPSPDNTSKSEGQEEEITDPTLENSYEVYLNFSGETHKGFTDFLYTYLVDAGIRVFENNINLPSGNQFFPLFLNYSAIKESKISIPIFSRNYASSIWCLQELAHMVHCHTTNGQTILPIFYDVDPKLVEHQLGSYQEAFHQHETTYEEKTIQEWKMALKEVAKIPGFVLHKRGGIGKTTIAKVIYNKLHERFECSCFLENVRELLTLNNGLSNLQSQLLSKIKGGEAPHISNVDEGINTVKVSLLGKKVLIVLDDVDQKFRIDKLVGKCELFGFGSRIIVTTRYKEVLNHLKVIREVRIYEPRLMSPDHSIHLFSKYAFMSEFPPEDYNILSKEVVSIAGGIALVLVTTGTLLFGKEDKELWEEILRKLKKLHEKDDIVKSIVNPKELDGEQNSLS